MKEVKAIIQPHMLQHVLDALHVLPHFPGITVSDCQGQGRGRGPAGHYAPTSESIFLAKRVKLEVLCADAIADDIVKAIRTAAHTGNAGDGIIMVVDLAQAVRIRTGEEQNSAL